MGWGFESPWAYYHQPSSIIAPRVSERIIGPMSDNAPSTRTALTNTERAVGALVGLAAGDALGMPTQSMSPEQIRSEYGLITGFSDASAAQPYAPNLPAGHITDDTEQALLVADLLIRGAGRIDPASLAHTLLEWEAAMVARGSLDLLGPSTKLALEQVRSGADPATTGRTGTTNGTAMRVTPVGIATSTADRESFTMRVLDSCRVTHSTHQGFESAALVAAAVSLGIDGAGVRDALRGAVELVASLEPQGAWTGRASVVTATRAALVLSSAARADDMSDEDFAELLRAEVGTSVESSESIPAAFALADRYCDTPFDALLAAANLGGDTDTIGAIAGAILGACTGPGIAGPDARTLIENVNGVDLSAPVDALLALRRTAPGAGGSQGAHPLSEGAGPGRVVLLGQVIVDLALRLDEIPSPGSDVFAEDAGMHAGGGFNALYAATRMGAEAVSLSGVGDGGFARIITAALEGIGVDDAGPRLVGIDSGYCVALTDSSGERTFVSTRGAETLVPAEAWADYASSRLHPSDVVYIDGYALAHPANVTALRAVAAQGMPDGARVIVDVSPMVESVDLADLLMLAPLSPLWSMNEREALILSSRLGLDAAGHTEATPALLASALGERLGSAVLVRAGEAGAWLHNPGEASPMFIPTPTVSVVDTNGAGDAHSGVLAAALVEGIPLERALVLANCAGALASTRVGPATCPSRNEVEAAADALLVS